MAIAPSKLRQLVDQESGSDDALIRRLREAGLVFEEASDDDLRETFRRAREEHDALPPDQQLYNSPNERVRVFLAPFLTYKGRRWAAPLVSLDLPDDDAPSRTHPRSPWWKFWD
jgi:hypothetical protein